MRNILCYIIHSTKHIGIWQISTPQKAKTIEPISMKLGMCDYVPRHITTLVGVAQREWSGQIRDLHICESLFLLTVARAKVAFLDRSAQSVRQNACFRPGNCILAFPQYL